MIKFTVKNKRKISKCLFIVVLKNGAAALYLRSVISWGSAVLTGVYVDTSCKSVDILGFMNIKVLFRRMCRRKCFSQTTVTHCTTT